MLLHVIFLPAKLHVFYFPMSSGAFLNLSALCAAEQTLFLHTNVLISSHCLTESPPFSPNLMFKIAASCLWLLLGRGFFPLWLSSKLVARACTRNSTHWTCIFLSTYVYYLNQLVVPIQSPEADWLYQHLARVGKNKRGGGFLGKMIIHAALPLWLEHLTQFFFFLPFPSRRLVPYVRSADSSPPKRWH